MQNEFDFDGAVYVKERDYNRLANNHFKLKDLMQDQVYRTLAQVSDLTNIPPASVSAGLRDFRKAKFGSHILNRKYLGNGLYSYQLILNTNNHG